MRKIKEVLRLKYECNISERGIALSCRLSRSTIADYLRRAAAAGIGWTEAAGINEADLERRLFPEPPATRPLPRPLPDFEDIHRQFRQYRSLNLTLAQLWLEYKATYPDGYQYSQFTELYRRWRKKLDYSMRHEHRGGEKVFIDYSDGLSIINVHTGEIVPTQIFVAVWGASNFTYAEASLSQTLPEWIGAHVRMFKYFGCVPRVIIPDNLKSGVNKACKYEPELNPTYADMAEHYGCAVLPARPYRARDKAKVEVGVLIAKRWVLAVLRQRTFYSLAELNAAIRECLEKLNSRLLRKAKKSRRELFETLDIPNALPVPAAPYEYAEWIKAKVSFDYHIEVDGHYYSVPFHLLHQKLDVRLTATTLEAFCRGERVVAHPRSYQKGLPTTKKEHMPSQHRFYAEWSPERFIQWAGKIGDSTAMVVARVIAKRAYPEQAYRTCMGILNLEREFERERIEAAAQRALKFNTCSWRSMLTILKTGLDRRRDPEPARQLALPVHTNIRGPEYYQ